MVVQIRKEMLSKHSRYFTSASAWLVIGMSVILTILVVGLAVMNFNRERQYMAQILSEKGASLIRAFEAGARTGMMGAFGTLPRLDTLIKETADQPDILYIAIVDSKGEILAHNDSDMVGKAFIEQGNIDSLEAGKEVKWRAIGDNSLSAFEVYKLFLPIIPDSPQSQMMSMMQQRMKMMSKHMGIQEENLLHPESRPIIVIGMDSTSFEQAINEDIKLTMAISGILLLLAVAGVVSLFWAQSYTRSRKLLSDIRAISSEMINNLPEGVILTDNNLNIRYLNKNAETMIGLELRDVIGRPPEQTLPSFISSP